MNEYKLYVWDNDVLTDYTSGIAVAAARSEEEARATILECAYDWEREQLSEDTAGPPSRILDLPAAAHVWGGG
jgi:hypothetical protein